MVWAVHPREKPWATFHSAQARVSGVHESFSLPLVIAAACCVSPSKGHESSMVVATRHWPRLTRGLGRW